MKNIDDSRKMGLCPFLLLVFLSVPFPILSELQFRPIEKVEGTRSNSRAVIDVKGAPDSVVWLVQLSDLHFSVSHPERALSFKRVVGPTLSMINPSLVFITGDLTDGKSKDLFTMKQNEEEWVEYSKVMDDVIEKSGLDKKVFYDLRGNHDNFGVPKVGGAFDFFQKHSVNSRLGRTGNVHSVTLQSSGWKHLFVGFDSTMEVGLRGPTNLFGHPTDQLLADLDSELSQWDSQSKESVTKISFGHFPLSFSAVANSRKSLKDVFLNHSLSAYLCGHLHTKFGKNLKRHHMMGHNLLSSEEYFQVDIHQATLESYAGGKNCSNKASPIKEFWEWEMGDWRMSRIMRILAIDAGHVSFVDIDFKLGAKKTIVLPTFPLDSRYMQQISSLNEYDCMTINTSSYETVRALVFSETDIVSVVAKIYDSQPGTLVLVMDASMKKHKGNETRGDLYTIPWNWRAFEDPSPDRFWLKIEAIDFKGRSTFSELRPFSINGHTAKLGWTWKEFLVMGCQWASLYRPMLWFVLLFLFSLLLLPKAFLLVSKRPFTYRNLNQDFGTGGGVKLLVSGMCWALVECSKITLLWTGISIYLLYLTFFPWFFGQIFTERGSMGYMTLEGWTVKISNDGGKQSCLGVPDVMVVVLPHLCFVVLPTILVSAGLAAEKVVYRVHYLSLSGKKEDDCERQSKIYVRGRWMRKVLLVGCFAVLWKHWKHCRALMKAYEMNPFLQSAAYCLPVPLLLTYAICKTRVQML